MAHASEAAGEIAVFTNRIKQCGLEGYIPHISLNICPSCNGALLRHDTHHTLGMVAVLRYMGFRLHHIEEKEECFVCNGEEVQHGSHKGTS